MYKQQKVREVFTFRHFSRTPYALFRVLGREVRVGVLSVATLSVAAPCLSQTAAKPLSDIRQAADTVVLGDAWVVASPSVTRLADAAAVQTQVLTREDLAAAGVTSINDALKLATGIDVRQRGGFGMQTDISIDGGTFDQIAFFVNGFPLNNPQTGHNAADLPVNLSDIVRIEILEGAAASVFGSQAFSGAVNVITKAPSKSPPAGGDLEGALSAGSYGTFLAEARAELLPRRGEAGGGLEGAFSLSYRRSDGAVENSDFRGGKAFWQGRYSGQGYHLSAQAAFGINDFGANTFYSAAYPNQWEATRRFHVGVRGETTGSVSFVPEFSWTRNVDHFQLIRGTHTAENFHRGDVFTGGFRSYARWKVAQGALLGMTSFGAELRQEEIFSSNLGRPMDEAQQFSHYTHHDNRTNVALSLGQALHWHTFALDLSLLAQRNSAVGRHFRLYPGANLSYRPSDGWKLYASWQRTLRLPTFTDLYYKSPTQEGNVGLKPEENSAWRLGAEYRARTWRIDVRGFYNHGTDMIDWVMYAADDIYHATSFRLDNMGVSLNAALDLAAMLGTSQPLQRFSAGYTYIHQERKDAQQIFKSNYALEYLRHKFTCRLDHAVWSRLSATWSLRLQRREGAYLLYQGGVSTGELTPYGTHAILDGRLQWRAPRYELFVEAQNLTATRYYDLGNVRQPGLFLLAGVKVRL
ncbi:MAG: TonB-dependent receptor [Alloprevotella sp.]|nr:TonB-dependent receptor [Alloprevotella sp.]